MPEAVVEFYRFQEIGAGFVLIEVGTHVVGRPNHNLGEHQERRVIGLLRHASMP